MTKIRIIQTILIGIILAAITACSVYDTTARKEPGVDYTKLRTYAWAPIHDSIMQKTFIRQFVFDRIHYYVDNELSNRGLKIDTIHPDIILKTFIIIEDKIQYVNNYPSYYSYPYFYRGRGFGWYYSPYMGYAGSSSTTQYAYKEGTIVVEFVRESDKKIVWTGYTSSVINKLADVEPKLKKGFRSIFKRYPIKKL